MATTTSINQFTDTRLANVVLAPFAPMTTDEREWTIHNLQETDVAAAKLLFQKLHSFNASLDARFALSADWETYFDEAIQQALHGEQVLALIAYETDTDRPCGFVLATIHADSGMWYYHEWVEVEGLYVEDRWRGRGLAEALLGQACEWANSIHQPVVQLYVTASNERAISFYQHKGFSQTQIIMRKVLEEAS
jgi:ribosomal protein S18 acetylase RimI-like enzyme